MNINSIISNNATASLRSSALQMQSAVGIRATNPAFQPDSVSFGSIASPFQSYTSAVFRKSTDQSMAKCWLASIKSFSENSTQIPTIPFNRIEQLRADKESGNFLYNGIASMNNGWINANVVWSENSSPDKPMVTILGINADNSPFEVEVSINDVDPRNATIIEMFALRGYFSANNTPFNMRTSLAPLGGDDSSRFDFVTTLHKQMLSQRFAKNWESYERLKTQVQPLLDHIARIGS
jgi:hypothetical protein